MHDLSVIVAGNEQAAREAQLKDIYNRGKAALYQKQAGIIGIGEIREYSTTSEAKQAALGLSGDWVLGR